MITDGEAYLVEEPAVIGAKNHEGRSYAGWMPYSRVFESLWPGRRHALVGPVQVDRWGQANISCLGASAKTQRGGKSGVEGKRVTVGVGKGGAGVSTQDRKRRVLVTTNH